MKSNLQSQVILIHCGDGAHIIIIADIYWVPTLFCSQFKSLSIYVLIHLTFTKALWWRHYYYPQYMRKVQWERYTKCLRKSVGVGWRQLRETSLLRSLPFFFGGCFYLCWNTRSVLLSNQWLPLLPLMSWSRKWNELMLFSPLHI